MGVDILRLSMNVHKNLQREAEHSAETGIEDTKDNAYGKQQAQEPENKVAGDVYITDRSMSLNFNEKEDEGQNEETELQQAEAIQKELNEAKEGQITPRGQTTTGNNYQKNNFMQEQPTQRATEPPKQINTENDSHLLWIAPTLIS